MGVFCVVVCNRLYYSDLDEMLNSLKKQYSHRFTIDEHLYVLKKVLIDNANLFGTNL